MSRAVDGGFRAGACLDLGAFDPSLADCGVSDWLARSAGVPSWVVVMEDREPDFFHGFSGYQPDARAPLNRHGPRDDAWTQADLKRLVQAFRERHVKVLLGYWIHECRFVDDDHPELLIRDQHGALWQDTKERNADFNPMRHMRADPARDVHEGETYMAWSGRQYAKLAAAFGFDGLFLGDGAMGFRRHGKDWKDLRHFDYHDEWLAEFRSDVSFMHHDGCALEGDAPTSEKSRDVQLYHWPHWVTWNTSRWTDYYATMARAVHATGGILAAYNCMNYDPALARLHGVDYRGIAESGLDILVFQAYDYAWGPLGPFGDLHIAKKDVTTNLQCLLRTRAETGFDTRMQIVITVETEDEVEGWDAPTAHTLGELHVYGNAVAHDGHRWRRAADGAFVVWGNSVQPEEWCHLAAALKQLEAPPAEPHAALSWSPEADYARVDAQAPTAIEPRELYAHLEGEAQITTAIRGQAPALRARARSARAP